MNTQKFVVGVVLVLSLVFSFVAYTRPAMVEKQFGATATLDGVDNPFVSIGGLRTAYIRQPLVATSSTICSIVNPLGTSTVNTFTTSITSGILGSNNVSLSTSTNAYATGTQVWILDHTISSNTQDVIVWSPNATSTASNRLVINEPSGASGAVVGPGVRLNLRLATTTGAGALTAYYGGTCSAIFRQI